MWGMGAVLRALTSNSSVNRLAMRGYTMYLFIILTLEDEVCVFKTELQ